MASELFEIENLMENFFHYSRGRNQALVEIEFWTYLNDEDCEQRLEEILESSDECKGEEKSFEEVTEDVQSYQKLPVIGFSGKFLHPIYALLGERQCNVNDQIMFFVNLLMNEVVE